MVNEKATLIAKQFIKLLEKKNVWDIDHLCSLLMIDPIEFAFFVKSLPMAYGLSLSKSKIYITHELVRDAKEEILKLFQEWLESTQPIEFNNIPTLDLDDETKLRGKIAKIPKRKAKISVFGERKLVEFALSPFTNKLVGITQAVGGYTPIDAVVSEEIEPVECQFLVLNYRSKKYINALPVITQLVQGYLLIYDPTEKLQYQAVTELVNELMNHQTKEITCTFIAYLNKDIIDLQLEKYVEELTSLAMKMAHEPIFHVSFSIINTEGELRRKITELVHMAASFLEL